MRISLNWLRDYLDIRPDIEIEQLSESLTLAGLEVEALEHTLQKASTLILGRVTAVKDEGAHESTYNLMVAERSLSANGPKAISVGSVVALRKSSEHSPIEYAVACFSDVGLSQTEPIVFEPDHFEEIPTNLGLMSDFNDVIITLGITPNRADALSHLGISRELSALLDCNPKAPMLTPKEMAGPTHEKVAIEIEDADDCPRYACRVIENIKVKESPLWLKLRLIAAGVRPINNVVDVTNYVMLSRGQPLHAFDLASLDRENGRVKIIVRKAHAGEKLVVLDGKELSLTTDDVVIADLNKALALAGVMGGKASSVSNETTTILLESAYFIPTMVRLSARRHGISSESSYRFERGSDPNGVVDALNFAARLLSEVADGKVCREPIDAYRKRIDPLEIKMRPERAQAVLGMSNENFDQDLLRKRFLRLGIETIAKRGDAIYFRVPTYRSDLTREIDLIEEAARMIGYDKIGNACVGLDIGNDNFGDKKSEHVVGKVRNVLAARGFYEAINYAFLPKDFHQYFLSEQEALDVVELKNPLSERYAVLRKSLIPGLIKNLQHNQNNQEKSVQLFEIGTVFSGKNPGGKTPHPKNLFGTLDQDSFCHEQQKLSGLMAGFSPYHAFDHQPKLGDFFQLKGVLEDVLKSLGLPSSFPHRRVNFAHGSGLPFLHPGESAVIVCKMQGEDVVLGDLGKIHPDVAVLADVSSEVYAFELNVKELVKVVSDTPIYKPFSRFPVIERDVAFLVDVGVRVEDLVAAAENIEGALDILTSVKVFDIYQGKNIEKGKKSVAISLSLQRSDRTLTDEDAEGFVGQFITQAQKNTGATLR